MPILSALVRALDFVNEWTGRAVSWLLVIMVINVFLVVVLRYAFGYGAVWMQEAYVWSHATVFLCAAGYTLLHDGHVRIDLIYRTASARYKAWVDIAGCVLFAGPVLYITFTKSIPMVERSWRIYEKSAEAGGLHGLYLFKSVILVFCILFGLQFLALFLRSIGVLVGRDMRSVYREPDDSGTVA